VPVDKLRPLDVQSLIDRWRADGMAAATVRRTFTVLRAALGWAERYQVIPDNPAARVRKPSPGRKDVSPPDPSDVVRLISAASDEPELAMFVRLAALTGARRGQLVALRWGDINFDVDPVTIRWMRSLAKVPGGTQEKGTKTGSRWQAALDPYTVHALKTLRRRAAERARVHQRRGGQGPLASRWRDATVQAAMPPGQGGGRPPSRPPPLDGDPGPRR
jgi:integrase